MASSAAQKYFNSFNQEQQNQIRASWGGQDLMQEWYDNAVRAGAVGNNEGGTGTDPANWDHLTGEERERISGLAGGDRQQAIKSWLSGAFDSGTINRWMQDHYSEDCPPNKPFRPDTSHMQQWFPGAASKLTGNECVEKPTDVPDEYRDSAYGPGGAPNGIPPENQGQQQEQQPVTHGTLLSYTGDPMQDMLIYQFNTKATLDGQRKNLFGLGEDRAVGGEGQDKDMQDVIAQNLAGGGLWWSGEESAFGNFGKPPGEKKGGPKPQPPPPQTIAAPPPDTPQPNTDAPGTGGPPNPNDILANLPQSIPGYKRDQIEEMLNKQYNASPGNQ